MTALLDELCVPVLAAQFREAFTQFRVGIPDRREEEVVFFRVRDGRLAEAYALEDTWGRMGQPGLAPTS